MIKIKTAEEMNSIKQAGRIVALVLDDMKTFVRPGISTMDIDRRVEEIIRGEGATPSFLNYGSPPFPASACVSVNDEVVHGIPSETRILEEGDIVSVDVGAYLDGWHGDAARTYPVGEISEEAMALIRNTRASFWAGFEMAKVGNRLGDISHAIEMVAREHNYGVVKELTGHGIGRNLHEDPQIPNYGRAGHGPRLQAGMVLAVEPMLNLGTAQVNLLSDDWTIATRDGKYSAHYENIIGITEDGPVILTAL